MEFLTSTIGKIGSTRSIAFGICLYFGLCRSGSYPRPKYKAHPKDCSVMSFTGHEVLRTLIRCHFSPAETTGGQYIYSGSADGRIHIWSLDGQVVQVLDRSGTLPMSFDPSGPVPAPTMGDRRRICVRDVSWHSQVRSPLPVWTVVDTGPSATYPDECWVVGHRMGR